MYIHDFTRVARWEKMDTKFTKRSPGNIPNSLKYGKWSFQGPPNLAILDFTMEK
jgi:hypothetical protein